MVLRTTHRSWARRYARFRPSRTYTLPQPSGGKRMAMVKGPDEVDGATPPPAEVQTGTGRLIRRRWVPADPLVPAVAAVSLVVYVLHGFNGFLGKDLGLYVYAGQRFAEGVPP